MVKTCVIFVNPFDFDRDISFTFDFHSGPLYLASFLKARFGEEILIEFLDLKIEVEKNHKVPLPRPGKWSQFLAVLDSLVARKIPQSVGKVIFAISCLASDQYAGTLLTGIALRHIMPDATIVVGGYHPSIFITDFLPYGQVFDCVVLGEGEQALADIVTQKSRRFLEGKVPPRVITGEPVENLNDLPLLDLKLFAEYLGEYPTMGINLSRGCPFTCAFCLERGVMSQGWRACSPDRAILEIRNQVKVGQEFGIRKFGFYDPIFGHDRAWRARVVEKMIQEQFEVEFWGETRCDALNREDLALYKRAKLYMMFGLESGSPLMLKNMHKTGNPRFFLDHFRKVMLWSAELKYPSVMNVLFNHPGETLATMQESQHFLLEMQRMNPYVVENSLMYRHYPGSELFNHADIVQQKYGTRYLGGNWWHLLTHQLKAAKLNQASSHLPVRIAQATFLQYEINRLELTLDNITKASIINLPKILQIKTELETARAALKEDQADKAFFAANPPQVPPYLWEEFPAILQESTLSAGQFTVVPQ